MSKCEREQYTKCTSSAREERARQHRHRRSALQPYLSLNPPARNHTLRVSGRENGLARCLQTAAQNAVCVFVYVCGMYVVYPNQAVGFGMPGLVSDGEETKANQL